MPLPQRGLFLASGFDAYLSCRVGMRPARETAAPAWLSEDNHTAGTWVPSAPSSPGGGNGSFGRWLPRASHAWALSL